MSNIIEWRDCDIHEDDCFIAIFESGAIERDCEEVYVHL